MSKITTYTGREWHSSYGAKGMVFVVDSVTKQETFIHETPNAAQLLDQNWQNVQEGKHGRWVASQYEVPDGTILKLFAISTWRQVPHGGGGAYLRVDSTQPVVTIEGDGYGERIGSITGSLMWLTLDEVAQLGIIIPAKYRHYYRGNGVTIKHS